MKKILLLLALAVLSLSVSATNADEARKILDKTTALVGRKSGAEAKFKANGKSLGAASGTIAIKGNKFKITTAEGVVWFDGKTQWTYMKSTDEVNITTPSASQQSALNPLTFINLYKKGYKLSVKNTSSSHIVHLVAESQKGSSIPEVSVEIDSKTYAPKEVKLRQNGGWTVITISNFKTSAQSDATFVFNKSSYPSAEIIDLR